MTKLLRFLLRLVLGFGLWVSILLTFDDLPYYNYVILPLPLWALVCFGLYSASVVIYRTLTFNDCPEAASELMAQIEKARGDLRRKGMKFGEGTS